jgi:restriction system protein
MVHFSAQTVVHIWMQINTVEYASLIESKIILIDGSRLASLMAEHNVGVSTSGIYEVKKIDSDYFEED